MSRGRSLSERQRWALYNQYCLGEKVEDLAEAYGISQTTAYKYIALERERADEQRKEGEEMAARSKIVAGDKTNGRLVSTTDPHRFEGTCVVAGKKHSKTFTTVTASKATEMWEEWCGGLRDEQEFMDSVERKEPEPKVVCGAPSDPIEEIHPIQEIEPAPAPDISVRPWREVAEERQGRINELEARVAELEQGQAVADHSRPVYVLWAKTGQPRLYGAYETMESALKELDKLNDIARFLGNEDAFEVEEVSWR